MKVAAKYETVVEICFDNSSSASPPQIDSSSGSTDSVASRQEVLPTRICSKRHIRPEREGGRSGPENWSDMHFAANSGRQYSLLGRKNNL